MKIGHLKHLVRSVIDLDEISAQCTCHTNTSWYCGGREGGRKFLRVECKPRGLKSSSTVVLLVEKHSCVYKLEPLTADSDPGRRLIILKSVPC